MGQSRRAAGARLSRFLKAARNELDVSVARLFVCATLGAFAIGCGSRKGGPDLGSDPQWGDGFSARLVDAGDPQSPGSAAVACSLFEGPPYAYASIADLTDHLIDKQWTGCRDNTAVDAGELFPVGFAALTFDGAGNWQAFVQAPNGAFELATGAHSQGTYTLREYAPNNTQYAGMFILTLKPPGAGSVPNADWLQFQGMLLESPEILSFYSSNVASAYYRFSPLPP
jgi:hypothetical protein